ncbi:MAG: prolipoprotein diacylglyceryl transferase [Deltaproteobacteria bacterium]|nr:prolipoprotein diacylglyceryl transferase [Deltaproteobacteria bacterium]
MNNLFFLTVMALLFGSYLAWGFRSLPYERWQMFASIPIRREENGCWQGINLTYYGLLTANAYLAAVAIFIILQSAIGQSPGKSLLLVVSILAVCVPASRLIALWVEKKAHTFTAGGASFVGALIAPWLAVLFNHLPVAADSDKLPVIPFLAAMSIAYCMGEGLGRLACISYGCCYGKPIEDCSPFLRKIFSRWNFVFFGSTKKIAYAGGLEGRKVVPVQAMTAIFHITMGLILIAFFLTSHFFAVFLMGAVLTHGWRICSEFLRADYRGTSKITAYQKMSIISIIYAFVIPGLFVGETVPVPDIVLGLGAMWEPLMLVFLQTVWIILFLYTGRSGITGSVVSFHVHEDRI